MEQTVDKIPEVITELVEKARKGELTRGEMAKINRGEYSEILKEIEPDLSPWETFKKLVGQEFKLKTEAKQEKQEDRNAYSENKVPSHDKIYYVDSNLFQEMDFEDVYGVVAETRRGKRVGVLSGIKDGNTYCTITDLQHLNSIPKSKEMVDIRILKWLDLEPVF